MCVELLTYADLSSRLNVSREAARALARRRRLPRSRSDGGKAVVSVDLSTLRYTPRPRRARRADPVDASVARIEAVKTEVFKAEIARLEDVATAYRVVFERERERADRLAVELTQAAAEATAANAWATRLEDEVTALRSARHPGGGLAGQAASRLGHLAAAIIQSDRAARR
ncbi:hypothetical protein [Bradyrhizobium sp. 1(2017)]|uniref:hypothetical protein n=1 Tax=Bradyrhizobium sp. 1(2017) TaxID=1404888 RepID=UPI00140F3E49|nr:hypothetical protein [Bradyrhizobium sp. 1(2017)]QIO36989.1 hypothetical protein HAP40_36920 [Bradyrhizobium sp. 1(2017)]